MKKMILIFVVFLAFIVSNTTSAMNKSSPKSVTDVAFICGQSSDQTSVQAVIMKNAKQVSSSVAITTMPTRDQAVYSTGNISFANTTTRADNQFITGPTMVWKKPILCSTLTNSSALAQKHRTYTMSVQIATGGAHIVIWPMITSNSIMNSLEVAANEPVNAA